MKTSKGRVRAGELAREKGSRKALESEAGGEQKEGRQGKQWENRAGKEL